MSLDTHEETGGADTGAATTTAREHPSVLRLEYLVASLTNPRTNFDGLEELAANIKEQGVLQPILVRPLPASRLEETSNRPAPLDPKAAWPFPKEGDKRKMLPRPTHEIIAGERRFRAAKLAGLETIPVLVRDDMNEVAVLAAQLTENDPHMRRNLTALEEAEGYQKLRDADVSLKAIADMVKRGKTHVHMRLQLLKLESTVRQVLREGHLDVSHAELIAAIPDPATQVKAMREFMTERADGRKMSFRDAKTWMEQNVMLKLDNAPFDVKDLVLIEAAGPCGDCHKNTSHNRDLFSAFNGPALCTDAKCYGAKAKAAEAAVRARAEAAGMEVIVGTEAKRLKPSAHNPEIKGFTRLDTKIDAGGTTQRLGALIDKKSDVKPVLFVDPATREEIKVLPNAAVDKLLQAKGLVDKPGAKAAGKSAAAPAGQQADKAHPTLKGANDALETSKKWKAEAMRQADAAMRKGAAKTFTGDVLRALLRLAVDTDILYSVATPLQKLWGLPDDDDIESVLRHIEAAPEHDLGRLTAGFLMSTELGHSTLPTPLLESICKQCGLDLDAIKAEVTPKRKAPESKAPAAPLAPAGGEKTKPKKPAGAAKLSAKEAQLGIADAMQSLPEPAALAAGADMVGKHYRVVLAVSKADKTSVGQRVVVTREEPRQKSVWTKLVDWPFPSAEICRSITSLVPWDKEAAPASPTQPADGAKLFPNDRVRFKDGLKSGGGKTRKVSGREGTVDETSSDGGLMVRFGDKAHECAVATPAELELVPAEVFHGGQQIRVRQEPGRLRKQVKKFAGSVGRVDSETPTVYAGRKAYIVTLPGLQTTQNFWPAELEAVDPVLSHRSSAAK